MNGADIMILVLLAACAAGALRYCLKRRHRGCCGDCAACQGCSGVPRRGKAR